MIEIILLIVGGVILVLSFLIPSREEKEQIQTPPMAKEEIKELVSREMDSVKGHVDDVVDEAVTYAMEKTERSLERLSNEKIMAINEYSDTVLAEIHRNHEETMFLYDMLNSKHNNLKNTVSEVNRTMKEAEETVNNIQRLTPESNYQRLTPESNIQRLMPESNFQQLMPESNIQRLTPEVTETPKAAFVRTAEEQMAKAAKMAEEIPFKFVELTADSRKDNSVGNFNGRILELYSQGKNDIQIARELGLGVGEVKLVIDLFDSQI